MKHYTLKDPNTQKTCGHMHRSINAAIRCMSPNHSNMEIHQVIGGHIAALAAEDAEAIADGTY